MSKKKGQSKSKFNDHNEAQELVPFKHLWKPAPSLKPSIATMNAYVYGNDEARAIIDAWRFKSSRGTRIIQMDRERYHDLVRRTAGVTFHG
ncbi:hypothetical protein ACFQBQ_00820 [Granulicella cerasi]|uniref:Uncharacterized protein n=1 Tax=Granulicella cerasi TaxID=741063 RepID=A0ABW1Z3M4_9BACT|nr:hypothetical protein [Granulicella cerasi]